jgi:hypothetical protein
MDTTDVSVTNTDNDSAGITVSPTSGLITEEFGGQAVFNIVLNSEPLDDVLIELASSDIAEGTISPVSLTFTPLNWNTPQSVTITGQFDNAADGDQLYNIITSPAVSTDNVYNGIDPDDVSVTNIDRGNNWVQATASAAWSPRIRLTSLIFDNKMWVIGGYNNDVWYSTDGANWTLATASAA